MLVLVRGLPGSGKTTLAHTLAGSTGVVCSADDFFETEEGYKFDPSKLGLAHKACLKATQEALEAFNTVYVANTFTKKWEMQPYLDLAVSMGVEIHIIETATNWAKDVQQCFEHCSHGVPIEAIQRMANRWEEAPFEESVKETDSWLESNKPGTSLEDGLKPLTEQEE